MCMIRRVIDWVIDWVIFENWSRNEWKVWNSHHRGCFDWVEIGIDHHLILIILSFTQDIHLRWREMLFVWKWSFSGRRFHIPYYHTHLLPLLEDNPTEEGSCVKVSEKCQIPTLSIVLVSYDSEMSAPFKECDWMIFIYHIHTPIDDHIYTIHRPLSLQRKKWSLIAYCDSLSIVPPL